MDFPRLKIGFSASIIFWDNVMGAPLDSTLLREADFLDVAHVFAKLALDLCVFTL